MIPIALELTIIIHINKIIGVRCGFFLLIFLVTLCLL
jgi:hypothetical protein